MLLILLLASHGVPAPATEIHAAELLAAVATADGPYVIDVRSPEEFAVGHVPGAVLHPIQAFPHVISELPVAKDRPVVIYCESGRRAQLAGIALRLAGYTDIRYLKGHMQEWRRDERPLAK